MMNDLHVGDIVARKSYGGDVSFAISDVIQGQRGKENYILRGLLYRVIADSDGDDLVKQDARDVYASMNREIRTATMHSYRNARPVGLSFLQRMRTRPGRVLHIDSSRDFFDRCMKFYREAGIAAAGRVVPESEQPRVVRRLLEQTRPDILVVTGHDGLRKGGNINSVDGYRNSIYYIESVKEARKYQPDLNKLCVFSGACQSYYEAIMSAGANFASSPGRILINAMDPAIVSKKVALTDSRFIVTPQEAAALTISGSKGIGGIDTKGRMIRV